MPQIFIKTAQLQQEVTKTPKTKTTVINFFNNKDVWWIKNRLLHLISSTCALAAVKRTWLNVFSTWSEGKTCYDPFKCHDIAITEGEAWEKKTTHPYKLLHNTPDSWSHFSLYLHPNESMHSFSGLQSKAVMLTQTVISQALIESIALCMYDCWQIKGTLVLRADSQQKL